MTRRWQGTALFAMIMAVLSATVAGRMLTGGGAASTNTSTSAPTGGSASSSTSGTVVTGKTEQTRFGPVQVSLSFDGSTITGVKVLQAPSGSGRDEMLTQYSTPLLEKEVIASQSARVDAISGATYTSEGYLASVQSAIDAHS
ncbi:FMN-binding protein [Gryllotalpicola protaetiae]|uniref:FMN-binding protein n=1 Tax=Gryllotalpicola protaetiae TaxID=2419771 RepID=A0A387BK21_9MICO|nr:FMN-binding protein [Gryllotalpicola protaetiae]AYG02632.1 FMN-binding protein [Gryllotalpicola protaetiae]